MFELLEWLTMLMLVLFGIVMSLGLIYLTLNLVVLIWDVISVLREMTERERTLKKIKETYDEQSAGSVPDSLDSNRCDDSGFSSDEDTECDTGISSGDSERDQMFDTDTGAEEICEVEARGSETKPRRKKKERKDDEA